MPGARGIRHRARLRDSRTPPAMVLWITARAYASVMDEVRPAVADDDVERVRREVYRGFVTDGRPPSRAALAVTTGLALEQVDEAMAVLATTRHVVLDDAGRVVMAHPFAAIDLHFSVKGRRTLWWGGCAWDSFAIPNLVPEERQVLVATTCPACGRAHAWVVTSEGPPEGDQVAHFLVPAAHVWDDVVHTCGHQRIFCEEACVEEWLTRTGNQRGSVFDLATLWRLAAHWYDGRLDSPYVRREPAQAKAYFAEVGLRGAFWGLPD
ncbi:organomercurial lyase [Microbacterium sp. NPDC057407]|uniref:organomercurial lyase n=1 Tax=Microbacterium sp. NPDC057407 TaxID=3346120 RepID=UPI00366CE3C6